jgi:hypothetical protein
MKDHYLTRTVDADTAMSDLSQATRDHYLTRTVVLCSIKGKLLLLGHPDLLFINAVSTHTVRVDPA